MDGYFDHNSQPEGLHAVADAAWLREAFRNDDTTAVGMALLHDDQEHSSLPQPAGAQQQRTKPLDRDWDDLIQGYTQQLETTLYGHGGAAGARMR